MSNPERQWRIVTLTEPTFFGRFIVEHSWEEPATDTLRAWMLRTQGIEVVSDDLDIKVEPLSEERQAQHSQVAALYPSGDEFYSNDYQVHALTWQNIGSQPPSNFS